jgi:uncharacterized protein with PQ loop repeat
MTYQFYFFLVLGALVFCIAWCDKKYDMLRDTSTANQRPYSFARVQLAWWTVIVLASFISILISRNEAPTFHLSTTVLLGMSAATTATARMIDLSDQGNPAVFMHQEIRTPNFFLDILSDHNGASIHRFQAILFNFAFGLWFIYQVLHNLPEAKINDIMPPIEQNNLILLGLSSATYAALKTTENKSSKNSSADAEVVPDEALTRSSNNTQG